MRRNSIWVALLVSAALLAACGGSGGGHTEPPLKADLSWNQGNWDEQDWQ